MSDRFDYAYIRADGAIHRWSKDLIDSEVAYARQTKAPPDAWCRLPNNEGGWSWKTMEDLEKLAENGNPFAKEMHQSLKKVAQEIMENAA